MENKNSKYCINCGKAIPFSSEFCPYCGAKQPDLVNVGNKNQHQSVSNTASKIPTSGPQIKKVWYMHWWVWVTALAALIFIVIAAINRPYTGPSSKSDSASTSSTQTNPQDADSSSDSVMVGDDKIDVSDTIPYNLSWQDNTWAGTKVGIDNVTVYKTDGQYTQGTGSHKTTFNGIIKVHFNLKAGRDINIYPTQAKLSTDDGQQVEADLYSSDNFDGELNSGTQSAGNVYFVLPKMATASTIHRLRIKWDGDYDTDDIEDENFF